MRVGVTALGPAASHRHGSDHISPHPWSRQDILSLLLLVTMILVPLSSSIRRLVSVRSEYNPGITLPPAYESVDGVLAQLCYMNIWYTDLGLGNRTR